MLGVVVEQFIRLVMVHFLCDFALQNERMALGKSKITNQLEKYVPWYYWLTAHSFIQGLGVYVVTENVFIGLFETVVHWIIDHLKCKGLTNIHQDQTLHIAFMLIYAILST